MHDLRDPDQEEMAMQQFTAQQCTNLLQRSKKKEVMIHGRRPVIKQGKNGDGFSSFMPLAPPPATLKCSLGCPVLDSFLQGGIPCGSITELVGECGSAKTQLCLQLLLAAQLPVSQGGLHASSLYLFTESYFPSRRLQQLASAFVASKRLRNGHTCCNDQMRAAKPREAPAEDQFRILERESNEAIENLPLASMAGGKVCSSDGRRSEAGSPNCVDESVKRIDQSEGGCAWNSAVPMKDSSTKLPSTGTICNSRTQGAQHWEGRSHEKSVALCEQFAISSTKHEHRTVGNNLFLGTGEDDCKTFDPCDNIFVQGIQTIDELFSVLDHANCLLSQPFPMPVKLIVIDSIAALFRSDFDNTAKDMTKRSDWFFKVASKLKFYAQRFGLAVVVTNQVVDCVGTEQDSRGSAREEMQCGKVLLSSGRRVIPALGLSWAHCVNTRLFLSRTLVPEARVKGEAPSSASIIQQLPGTLDSPEGVKRESNPGDDQWGSARMVSSQNAVLQQLESELPDSLLLGLPYGEFIGSAVSRKESVCCSTLKPEILELRRPGRQMNATDHANLEVPIVVNPRPGSDFQSFPNVSLKRTLQVVFAPHLPPLSCEFVVERDQICGISLA